MSDQNANPTLSGSGREEPAPFSADGFLPIGAGALTPAPLNPRFSPQLAGVGATQAPAPVPSLAEANRILRRIADHELAVRRITEDAEAQMAEILEWQKGETSQHEREIAILKARLEPWVAVEIERDPRRKKSVKLPSGEAGYRTPPQKVVVEDPEAFISWARAQRPDLLRTPPPEPALRAIKEAAVPMGDGSLCVAGEEPGEFVPVPGVRLEQGRATFWVTTGAGGRR